MTDTMRRYEILILAVPEITQDESKTLEKEIDRAVMQNKGSIVSFERWGKYRLSYPVDKNDYGVYFLARFETDQGPKTIEDLNTLFTIKLNNFVMRDMSTRLPIEGSLAYQRPKSLEESPATRDVSAFLKENKMEGLLSSVDKKKAHPSRTSAPKPEKEKEVVAETVEVKETVQDKE